MKHLVAGYYDDLKTTRMQQELSIGECVDDAVENSPEDCGFVIPEHMYSSEDVDADNLVENILEHWNQSGYKTRIIKDIIQVVMDMNEDDIDDIKKFRTHLRNYVKTNFEAIARHVLKLKFPNKESIEKILKKHEPIERNGQMLKRLRKVTLEAYENVKRWLAKEAPDLELEVMDENDIRFGADGNYGTTCKIDKDGVIHAEIEIDPNLMKRGDAVLLNTIYHELVHCIKDQAKEADEKRDKEEYNIYDQETGEYKGIDEQAYQTDAHSDDIWKRGSDIVSRNSGYDIQRYVTDKEVLTKKINQYHVASILCYDCRWFDIYDKFEEDCMAAANGNFKCKSCGSADTHIIFAGEDHSKELQIINDALTQINRIDVRHRKAASLKRLVASYEVVDSDGEKIDFDSFLETVDGRKATQLVENMGTFEPQKFYDEYMKKCAGMDVRTTLLTAPLYGTSQSYSEYLNGNTNNELYKENVLGEPVKKIETMKDYLEKYFEKDGFTLKKNYAKKRLVRK